LASVFGFSHAGGEAPMLDVIEKTARHLGEMRFVPDAQRVGNNHPPLRAVFCQTDARISRLQRGHSVFEGNGDIGGRHARAGPDGSNPVPSSGESRANLNFLEATASLASRAA
jgi:hypothetical protein